MSVMTASDAKREFGEVLLKAQKSPVRISKNGKPVAVVVSANDYANLELLQRLKLKEEITKGLSDLQAGRIKQGDEVLARLYEKLT